MDVMGAADHLRKLLVACDHADRQVTALEQYTRRLRRKLYARISTGSQQKFLSAKDGNQNLPVHTIVRMSVCEGVLLMYQQYHRHKWQQVQETIRSITLQLTADDNDMQQTSPPPEGNTSTLGGSTSTDMAAVRWIGAFCKFYRDN